MEKIETPCIGVCSTGIGDDVCRGCKRYAHEVIAWNSYSVTQRQSILKRIDTLLDQIVLSRFLIVDNERLDQFIQAQGIRHASLEGDGTKIFRILKAGASQIFNASQFGCELAKSDQGKTFSEVCQEIDKDYYQLSIAHYERFFKVNGHV